MGIDMQPRWGFFIFWTFTTNMPLGTELALLG